MSAWLLHLFLSFAGLNSLELCHIWAKLTWLLCCLTKCPTVYKHVCVYPMLFLPHTLWTLCGQVSLTHGCTCRAHYTLLGIVSKTEKNILPEHCKTDLLLNFIIKQISVLTHIIGHFFLRGFLQFSDLPLYSFPSWIKGSVFLLRSWRLKNWRLQFNH